MCWVASFAGDGHPRPYHADINICVALVSHSNAHLLSRLHQGDWSVFLRRYWYEIFVKYRRSCVRSARILYSLDSCYYLGAARCVNTLCLAYLKKPNWRQRKSCLRSKAGGYNFIRELQQTGWIPGRTFSYRPSDALALSISSCRISFMLSLVSSFFPMIFQGRWLSSCSRMHRAVHINFSLNFRLAVSLETTR